MKLFNKLFLVFSLIILTSIWVSAQTRGGDLEAAVGRNVTVGKQWAVFIAIDRYQEWGALSNPVRDAKEIRDILRENYYIDEVRELYDQAATAAGIRQLFVNLRSQVGRDDSVFVFYAGHGYTDQNSNTGFWIPSNGGRDMMAQVNWLPNIQVRNMLTQLPAKHVFLISDSCFSGDLLNASRGAPVQIDSNYYRQAYSKVSRQVMTSGASESVPDASEFALRLKSGLRRAEGACIDPEYLFTTAGVREVKSTQPLLGTISGSEHQDGGSFLFFRRQTAAAVAPQPAPQTTTATVSPPPAPIPANTVTAAIARPVSENFVRIERGTFMMGSPENEPERYYEETQHRVTVSSFYMGKYQVTQKEYQEIMGTNPSHFKGDNLPVEMVSWYDAVEYCNRLSQSEGLTPAYTIDKSRSDPNNRGAANNDTLRWVVSRNPNANGYRLPTEAEWEYACRAGTTTRFNTGFNITGSNTNYGGNKTTAVGSFAPNPWGLYDMHGNVREWCWDWYGYGYQREAQTDPMGASSGYERVVRGGSWNDVARDVRSAYRGSYTPSTRFRSLGFRLVRPL